MVVCFKICNTTEVGRGKLPADDCRYLTGTNPIHAKAYGGIDSGR